LTLVLLNKNPGMLFLDFYFFNYCKVGWFYFFPKPTTTVYSSVLGKYV